MVYGNILRTIREELRLGQEDVAILYNEFKDLKKGKIYVADISNYETGKRRLTFERLVDFVQAVRNVSKKDAEEEVRIKEARLSVSKVPREKLSQILNLDQVDLDSSNLIPVYSSIGAGFVSDSEIEVLYFFPLPPNIKYDKKDLFWAVVHGDSMADEIEDKDWVLIRKGVGDMIDGDPYVFWLDGDYTLKTFKRKSEPGVYELVPKNPLYEPILVTKERSDHVYPAGEVLNVLKRMKK